MDPQILTVLVALLGTVAGSLGTWMVSRYRDRERDASQADQTLRDKVHQLEIRIVKLEVENNAFIAVGRHEAERGGPDA
ncbi:MAG: hypothetical protein AABY18_02520 [Candidatus Thermoplasmatota archaeon]